MRHDPASAPRYFGVVVMLRGLKMYGMAQAVGDLIEQGAPAFEAAVPMLSQLLKAEMAEREVRSIAYQGAGTGKSHIPPSFNAGAQPITDLPKALLSRLSLNDQPERGASAW